MTSTEQREPEMVQRTSALIAPTGRWWAAMGRDERLWTMVVVAWGVSMFVFMLLIWPAIGQQNVNMQSVRIEPQAFDAQVTAFIDRYKVGEEKGVAIVEPPPGEDVWVKAYRFQFIPILRLKQGQEYRFRISSTDVQHGFSLQPSNLNFQVLPGYTTEIKLTPKEAGDYQLVCNEYCGPGHHVMLGALEVTQ